MNPTDYPKSTAEVCRYITKAGFKGVTINKGPGYFCFEGDLTNDWRDHTVEIPFLKYLTLEQWLQVYKAMDSSPANSLSVIQCAKARECAVDL